MPTLGLSPGEIRIKPAVRGSAELPLFEGAGAILYGDRRLVSLEVPDFERFLLKRIVARGIADDKVYDVSSESGLMAG